VVAATLDPIVRWFSPPLPASTPSARRARALWMVSWSFFGVLTVLLAAAIAVTPATFARRGTSIIMVGLLVLILHAFNRRGRTDAASWMLVLGLVAIVTQRAWYTGGVHAPVSMFYILFVLIGAGVLGVRGSMVTALACMVSATLLTGAELAGWIPGADPGTTAVAFVNVTLSIAGTLLCLKLLLRQAEEVATDDLVKMFVHDMRSPLTVVMARLTMLRAEMTDGSDIAEHSDAAMAETMRLSRMANNLLDISRLEVSGLPIVRTPTDVAGLARKVVHALAALDPECHIEVDAPEPAVCECDSELIQRLIENLVSNAIRYAPPGGHIDVAVSSTPGWVRFTVTDDGPGVPRDLRERIFERYFAGGTRARNGHHSLGLGLAFCKLAVEAHGGRIRIEDAMPRGSVFVVELPRK